MIVPSTAASRQTDWRADPRTLELLRHLWRGGWGHLWRRPGTSYWTNPQELARALARLDDRWATDTYFGVHPTAAPKSAYERARGEDVAAVNCLFADFDGDDLSRLEALRPAPQVVVASGGGYHAYWLLAEPVALADESTRRDWAAIQRWWVRHVGADPSASDLARLLRVPGTRNAKYDPPRPVRFVRCDLDAPHDNAELMRYIADARAAELARSEWRERPVGDHRNGSVIDAYNEATDIRDALREHGYALVAEQTQAQQRASTSDSQRRAIGGVLRWLAGQRPGNRNCATYWAAHRLREAGVTHQHAQQILLPITCALGLPEREAARTIASAYGGGQ